MPVKKPKDRLMLVNETYSQSYLVRGQINPNRTTAYTLWQGYDTHRYQHTLHTYQYQMSFTNVTRCLVLQIESNSDAFKMQSETWLWAKVSSWTLHSLEWRAPVVPGRSHPGWWKVLSIFKVWQGNEIIRFSDRKRVRTWEILSTIYGKVWKGEMPID